jgi:hypothetical protein
MARRFCALLLILGLAASAAAQAHSPSRTPLQPCGSGVTAPRTGDGSVRQPLRSFRPQALVRLTKAAVRLVTHVTDLPAWLAERRGDGRSWANGLKEAVDDLKRSFAEAYGPAYGAGEAGV